MSARLQGHQGGHVHPQQWETNDNAATLGADLAQPADLAEKYNETLSHSLSTNAHKNYCCRIKKIIDFWKENDNAYWSVGVWKVSAKDLANPVKYYYGKMEDIMYEGLNESFVLHFLVSNKKKADGKLKSLEDLWK